MQILPSADVLVGLQLGSGRLVIRPTVQRPFGDLELRALVTMLEDANGAKLKGLRQLDLSLTALGPASMFLVAQLFRNPRCAIEMLDLSNQAIEEESFKALLAALRRSASLRKLRMHSCRLFDLGGLELLAMLRDRSTTTLREIDLQNNYMSFKVCAKLSEAAAAANTTAHTPCQSDSRSTSPWAGR